MPDLATASSLYGVTEGSLRALGAFESEVFQYDGPHGPSILKAMPPGHRAPEQVQAEVDWLLALLASGLPVAEPLRSARGEWVEPLEDGTVLVAYRRAPGELVKPADWTDERIERWGELVGRLQAHGRSWEPVGPRRDELIRRAPLGRLHELVPADEAFVRAAAALFEEAAPLLGGGADSGLVHADLHQGNLLLHEERWTAIDFDDCGYASYAFDLAMPIYYAVRSQREVPAAAAAERFVAPYLRGFRKHAPDPLGGAEAVALALRLRQAELVLALRQKLPAHQWTEALHQVERELRSAVKEARPVVEEAVLRRCFA